jgi:hypothetical protein
VVADLELAGQAVEFADHEVPPPSEAEHGAFISPRGQLLNQSPELRDC